MQRLLTILSTALLVVTFVQVEASAQRPSRTPTAKAAPPECDSPFDFNDNDVLDVSDILALAQIPDAASPFDLNGDTVLGTADLLIFLSLFGTEACEADVDMDGVVDSDDLEFFILFIY